MYSIYLQRGPPEYINTNMIKTIIQQYTKKIDYLFKDELELLKNIQKLFTMSDLDGINKDNSNIERG
ncbi:hypothetical protein A2V55_00850 [Candidatus Woesebacteria bacterium RBG_19FT_COMBO_37_29]|uniref:Uncharacterized protein n=2 Tax=Candidatus Woeseibacteriota TaxID=1752722 RepID=A0A1F7XN42_9BACT|nr:MAG: hypothetical protein A2Z67_00615 [Candidatus Woesebacteria bacterium RBG_13_36_22]OGM16482.1 MAG: hypothetical protein A2V55_00850 [Candidatus Woesebacteria bacterium RBG_19FT_COMBO_37_29]